MGNYENLKQSITEVIRTNGNKEITGAVLQSTLLTIISTVGANATFAGLATPATNPGTPDGSVFYIASESGTYSNFGGAELQDGLSVLMWNGSWSSQQIFSVDDEPTAGSDNLVKSGGIQEELALGAVYDVSAKNPTAGPNNDGKFESLSALLEDANLNILIPVSVRKGGMSIKFVQSSDNNYVQYRLMANTFSTTTTDWQGVDDEPTTYSNNLVKSGGVYNAISNSIERNNIFFYYGYDGQDIIAFRNCWYEIIEQVYDKDVIDKNNSAIPNLKEIFEYTCEENDGKILFFDYWYTKVNSAYTAEELDNYLGNLGKLDFIYNICFPDDECFYLCNYWYEFSLDNKTDLDIDFPTYLFMCDMGNSNTGNEYIASIYPEACAKSYITDLKIGGNKKGLIQRIKSSNLTEPTISETKSFIFSAKGHSDKNINVNVVFSNRYNARNKNIELLCIGDSITEQSPSLGEVSGSWVCNIGKFAAVDDISIGNIKVNLIGTRNIYSKSVSFNNQTRTVVNNSEGRSGWATYTYLNWPIFVRLDGPNPNAHFIGREAMFYALGLSTKTPYNSSTPGQTAISYDGIYNEEIVKTPFGRYKIDYNEVLWEEMKSCYTDFPGTGEYSPVTSNTIIQQYFDAKCDNPSNVFYDINKARAYTGDYVWTYNNAFSINKYLERYRTCDDHGNTLIGSAGETVIGEDGETYVIGSNVTNTESFKVCKPTHIITALGTNDFGYISDEVSAELQDILHTAIRESIQDVILGYWFPRSPGVLNIQEWQNYGYQKLISSLKYKKNILYRELNPSLSLSNKATYIPAFYTASPLGASTNRIAYDLDDITEVQKIISGSDETHPSAITHRSIGYQCLAWLYWTLQY